MAATSATYTNLQTESRKENDMDAILEVKENEQYMALAQDLREIAAERKQDAAVSLIDRALDEFSKGTFSLAVLGMVNRGKSTFCNALLGADSEKYAPVGKTPVSNAISVFEKGEDSVLVEYQDGHRESVTVDDIPQFITEQLNPGNRKNVRCLHIKSAFPRLPDGVTLVDTPGEGSLNAHHDDILYKYLPSVDAAIFLIDAFSPLTESELDFLKEIMGNDVRKLFFAMNRIDRAEQDEIESAIEHNLQALAAIGLNVSKIYPISARVALNGNWEKSGLSALFKDVESFLGKEKFRIPRQRFLNRIVPVIGPLESGIDTEIAARTKTADELREEIANLTSQGEELEKSQTAEYEKLRLEWDSASVDFFTGISKDLTDLEFALRPQIAQIGVFSAKDAKNKFANILDIEMGNAFNRNIDAFNARIAAALQKLPIVYGGLDRADGSMGAAEALRGGTQMGVGKIAFASILSVLGIPLVAGGIGLAMIGGASVFLHSTKNRIKEELLSSLSQTINHAKNFWESQRQPLEDERDKLIATLSEQFQFQMSPTVQALQDALESQGKIDTQYDERLKMLQSLIASVRERADGLVKSLEG